MRIYICEGKNEYLFLKTVTKKEFYCIENRFGFTVKYKKQKLCNFFDYFQLELQNKIHLILTKPTLERAVKKVTRKDLKEKELGEKEKIKLLGEFFKEIKGCDLKDVLKI